MFCSNRVKFILLMATLCTAFVYIAFFVLCSCLLGAHGIMRKSKQSALLLLMNVVDVSLLAHYISQSKTHAAPSKYV